MTIKEGYSEYKCEVSGCMTVAYLLPTDAAVGNWREVERTRNGVDQPFTLCPQHASIYATLEASQQSEIDEFLGGKI